MLFEMDLFSGANKCCRLPWAVLSSQHAHSGPASWTLTLLYSRCHEEDEKQSSRSRHLEHHNTNRNVWSTSLFASPQPRRAEMEPRSLAIVKACYRRLHGLQTCGLQHGPRARRRWPTRSRSAFATTGGGWRLRLRDGPKSKSRLGTKVASEATKRHSLRSEERK